MGCIAGTQPLIVGDKRPLPWLSCDTEGARAPGGSGSSPGCVLVVGVELGWCRARLVDGGNPVPHQ